MFFLNSWTFLIGLKAKNAKKLAVWQTMKVWVKIVVGYLNLKPKND